MSGTLELVQECAPHYRAGLLTGDCAGERSRCSRVPQHCSRHNAVYTILHYLTDTQFSQVTLPTTCTPFVEEYLTK